MWKDCCDYPHFIAKVCNIFEVSYDSVGAHAAHHPEWKLYKLGLKWAKTSHIFRYQGHLWKCQDPLQGKKKHALLSILRPKPMFFLGEWNPFEFRDLPLLWNDILTTCSQFLYSSKILLLLGIFTGPPPPMVGVKTPWGFYSPWSHQKPKARCVSQRGPPPWLRKPVPSPEISRSFIAKKCHHSGDHLRGYLKFPNTPIEKL